MKLRIYHVTELCSWTFLILTVLYSIDGTYHLVMFSALMVFVLTITTEILRHTRSFCACHCTACVYGICEDCFSGGVYCGRIGWIRRMIGL